MACVYETAVQLQESVSFLKNNSNYRVIIIHDSLKKSSKRENQNPYCSSPKGHDPFVNAAIWIAFQTDF